MKNAFQILAAATLLLTANSSLALNACESAASIIERADDEVCDYFVEASEKCFQKLNKELVKLQKSSKSEKAAKSLKDNYSAAILTVDSYFNHMERDTCGDQRARLEVMKDELNIDLKSLDKISGK